MRSGFKPVPALKISRSLGGLKNLSTDPVVPKVFSQFSINPVPAAANVPAKLATPSGDKRRAFSFVFSCAFYFPFASKSPKVPTSVRFASNVFEKFIFGFAFATFDASA